MKWVILNQKNTLRSRQPFYFFIRQLFGYSGEEGADPALEIGEGPTSSPGPFVILTVCHCEQTPQILMLMLKHTEIIQFHGIQTIS